MPETPTIVVRPDGELSIGSDGIFSPALDSTTDPSCCCTPSDYLLFLARPCGSSSLESSSGCLTTPDPSRVWIRGDALLSDAPSVIVADRGCELLERYGRLLSSPVVINPGDACFVLSGEWAYLPSTDPSTRISLRSRFIAVCDRDPLPDAQPGERIIGDAGVVVTVAADCLTSSGCSLPSLETVFVEAVPCDGIPCRDEPFRIFVCADYPGSSFRTGFGCCLCLNRSRKYTEQEVAELVTFAGAHVYAPDWREPGSFEWVISGTSRFKIPSASCCTCAPECLRCTEWARIPGTGPNGGELYTWREVCGGTRDGLRMTVVLSSTVVDTVDGVEVFRQTASVVSSLPSSSGGSFRVVVRVRQITPDDDQTFDVELFVPSTCCLFGNPDYLFPWPGELRQVVDGSGEARYEWLDHSELVDLATAFSRTLLGPTLSFSQYLGAGTASYQGGWFMNGCLSGNARLTQTIVSPGRRIVVDANLSVSLTPDYSGPCAQVGSCAGDGWIPLDITELVP